MNEHWVTTTSRENRRFISYCAYVVECTTSAVVDKISLNYHRRSLKQSKAFWRSNSMTSHSCRQLSYRTLVCKHRQFWRIYVVRSEMCSYPQTYRICEPSCPNVASTITTTTMTRDHRTNIDFLHPTKAQSVSITGAIGTRRTAPWRDTRSLREDCRSTRYWLDRYDSWSHQ